jgi:hypothetical protein
MKTALLNTLILSFLFISNLLAVVPDSGLKFPNHRNKNTQKIVAENDLKEISERIKKVYSDLILKHYNTKLEFNIEWANDDMSAFATRTANNEYMINVYGGMARAPGMTKDAMALVLCHELGHHIGGAPKTTLYEGWPSAEGQADYFAASKCMKRYYSDLMHEEVDINTNIPEKIIADCNRVYKNLSDLKICVRTMIASMEFGQFLNNLKSTKFPVKLDTPDPKIVKGTNINDYPRAQCRFDTLYAGALCPISSDVLTSNLDAGQGQCMDTDKPGFRPRCWFYK